MKHHYRITFNEKSIKPGFRYHTMEKAYFYDITGKLLCKEDGNVIIEAEGKEQNILKFIEWHKERMYEEHMDDLKFKKDAIRDYIDFVIFDEADEKARQKLKSRLM